MAPSGGFVYTELLDPTTKSAKVVRPRRQGRANLRLFFERQRHGLHELNDHTGCAVQQGLINTGLAYFDAFTTVVHLNLGV